jgi:hypothetical protein
MSFLRPRLTIYDLAGRRLRPDRVAREVPFGCAECHARTGTPVTMALVRRTTAKPLVSMRSVR